MSVFGGDEAYSQMQGGFFGKRPAPRSALTAEQLQANSELRNKRMSQQGKSSLPAYAPDLGENRVSTNAALGMDAWRQRRSQVGQGRRDLLANQRSAMEKAMQKDDRTPSQRMFDIQQAQRKRRIWA